MSKKVAVEVRVIEFFQDAPLAVAQSILNIVRGNVKRREASENALAPAAAPKPKRKQRGARKVAAPAHEAGEVVPV